MELVRRKIQNFTIIDKDKYLEPHDYRICYLTINEKGWISVEAVGWGR